jgi:hypothetical protein
MIDAAGNVGHRNSLNELQWRRFAGRPLSRHRRASTHRKDRDRGD